MSGYFDTYRGVVLDNNDPTGEQRLQVQVPDVAADQSTWAKPEQSGATLPNVGDEVWISYENGDESYPIWSLHAAGAGAPADHAATSTGYPGTYHGAVLDNVDPGGYQRVQVQVPDVSTEPTMWAMPGQPGAALPAIGDEVWIRFENGDVSYPTWTGGSGTGGSGAAPAGTLDGTYRGAVLDNNDPGGHRRVLVQLPDVAAGESMWAMPERQDAAVPEIGSDVSVRFEQGDRQHPIWSS